MNKSFYAVAAALALAATGCDRGSGGSDNNSMDATPSGSYGAGSGTYSSDQQTTTSSVTPAQVEGVQTNSGSDTSRNPGPGLSPDTNSVPPGSGGTLQQ